MQILIDIPKETLQEVCARELSLCPRDEKALVDAIRNGTPLPKGHGRLKDVDWIDDNCRDYRTDDDGSWCYKWKDIDNAPTIIEADEEGNNADCD